MPYWHKETCGQCNRNYRTTYQGNHPLCPSCREVDDTGSYASSDRYDSGDESGSDEEWKELKMYHGTSWENALEITASGFKKSYDGCLGAGVYVARYEKARKFALALNRHGGNMGGMVEVIIRFQHPKYVSWEDCTWQDEGYDACRADKTAASTNMEWCVAEPYQVRVLDIWTVDPDDPEDEDDNDDDDDADEEEIQEHMWY